MVHRYLFLRICSVDEHAFFQAALTNTTRSPASRYLSPEAKVGDALICDQELAPVIVLNFRVAILVLRNSPSLLIDGDKRPRCKPVTPRAAVYLPIFMSIGSQIWITVRLFQKWSTPNSPKCLDILLAL